MTYNFDPDLWLENRKRVLDARRRAGDFDETAYREALVDLESRYEAMVERLDGTFTIPSAGSQDEAP
ncbi:MAG: hypothetical protein ACOYXN_03615 [Acidobacteriota bacterium]